MGGRRLRKRVGLGASERNILLHIWWALDGGGGLGWLHKKFNFKHFLMRSIRNSGAALSRAAGNNTLLPSGIPSRYWPLAGWDTPAVQNCTAAGHP